MKRSEMLKYITSELQDTLDNLEFNHQTLEVYLDKQSKEMLDMIEGFGMQPPAVNRAVGFTTLGKILIKLGLMNDRQYSYNWEDYYEWEEE